MSKGMTVGQLIKELEKVEDKKREVLIDQGGGAFVPDKRVIDDKKMEFAFGNVYILRY